MQEVDYYVGLSSYNTLMSINISELTECDIKQHPPQGNKSLAFPLQRIFSLSDEFVKRFLVLKSVR